MSSEASIDRQIEEIFGNRESGSLSTFRTLGGLSLYGTDTPLRLAFTELDGQIATDIKASREFVATIEALASCSK